MRPFSAENIDWLTLLYWLRATGMPMKTRAHLAALYCAGTRSVPERKALLLAHGAQLRRRRAELDRCEEILAHKLAIYRDIEGDRA